VQVLVLALEQELERVVQQVRLPLQESEQMLPTMKQVHQLLLWSLSA